MNKKNKDTFTLPNQHQNNDFNISVVFFFSDLALNNVNVTTIDVITSIGGVISALNTLKEF